MSVSWDAVILTGGRATRLDGTDKASLVGPDGRTCLQRTIDACSGASSRVVVGRPCDDPRVISTREAPPYSGPARAICAGLAILLTSAYKQESFPKKAVKCWNLHTERAKKCAEPNTSGDFEGRIIVPDGGDRQDAKWIMVLACDMPHVGQAIPLLLDAAESASTDVDGIVSVSDGHPQWLCALYRRSSLVLACSRLPENGADESVRSLIAGLSLSEIPIPEAVAYDIDTPADLRTLGFHAGHEGPRRRPSVRQPKVDGTEAKEEVEARSTEHGSSVTACQTENSRIFHNESLSMYREP